MKFEWLKNIVTGADNQTHDVARWSWVLSMVTTVVGAAWNAVHANILDLTQFAQAVGIISGAHGAAVMLKKDTEPKANGGG
jgi:cytosine/uracil/thiamine/allantoin permease